MVELPVVPVVQAHQILVCLVVPVVPVVLRATQRVPMAAMLFEVVLVAAMVAARAHLPMAAAVQAANPETAR